MAIRLREGLKFRPTDQELINDYLFKKIVGEGLPFEGIILERDVYDQHVLSEIFRSWVDEDEDGDVSRDTQSYFFTRLKKKTANGETYCRTVGNGTWRSQYSRVINADEYDDESIPIGVKRSLEYIDSGSIQHKNWTIMEFSLAGVSLEHPLSSSDYVVCLLEKKVRAIKRDRQKNMQSKNNARGALVNLPSACDPRINKRMRLCEEPVAKVDEGGGCTSRKQEIRMLPAEKSHLEYRPSIAAPESLADDAVIDSIILLSTTVEGFAENFIEDFADQFLNGN